MPASYDDVLREQISYYRARAGEYDEWFLRQGRYDRGAATNAHWHVEAAQVAATLDAFLAGRERWASGAGAGGGDGPVDAAARATCRPPDSGGRLP